MDAFNDSTALYAVAMRTVGIDFASRDADTAACVIDWVDNRAEIVKLQVGIDDAQILDLLQECEKLGVDGPLGWPLAFVDAVSQYARAGSWPQEYDHANNMNFRLRATDRAVQRMLGGRFPLSVAANYLAIPAMRAAGLFAPFSALGPRDGTGRVVEVYPAAALRAWNLGHKKYKGTKNADNRYGILREFREAAPWLHFRQDDEELCRQSDDAIDAVIAAVVARAAALNMYHLPHPEEVQSARLEGWIIVPEGGCLNRLNSE